MANSKKANAGAAKLATGTKAKGPKKSAAESKSTHPDVFEDIQAAYKFTADETAHLNSELRAKLDRIDELEDQKKAAMQDFKLRITNAENEAKQIRNKLNAGEETRPVHARVEFEPKRSMKKLFHPESGDFIREDPMQPADFQLPMFKPAGDGKEVVAPKGSTDVPGKAAAAAAKPKGKGKEAAADNAGKTPVGDKLDQAAAGTQTPGLLSLDLTKDHTHDGLLKEFKAAARAGKWSEAQISVIGQQLRLADGVDKMVDILRPHTSPPAEKPPFE